MRIALLLVGLVAAPETVAQIGVRRSFDTKGETWVLLGAENLDEDPANELVLGVPAGLSLSRVVIRDGVSGEIDWDSADILIDPSIRVAGWTGSYATYHVVGGDPEYSTSTERYGDSPFADVDGDGQRELVFFEPNTNKLYVIGADGWRPEPAAAR